MAYEDLVRSHVERCLQDVWSTARPAVDAEGDYPFLAKQAIGWVRVELQPPILIRVFAHAAYGVKRSAALLQEINAVNLRSRLATVCWSSGVVSVSGALPAESLDRPGLRMLIDSVSAVADDIGELTAAVFGGQVPSRSHEDAEG